MSVPAPVSPPIPALAPALAPAPVFTPALSPDHWWRLLKEMERFASNQLRLYRWRGLPGGVPPDGFDASSLAAEVIAELLSGIHCPDASAQNQNVADLAHLQAHLRRRIWRLTDHLHRRKENQLLNNEADLSPIELPDGHLISQVDACLSDDPSPDQLLIQKEDNHLRTDLQQRFLDSLAGDPPLQQFYHQLLAHEISPQLQLPRLNLSCRALDNFRKRLRRRFHRFHPG